MWICAKIDLLYKIYFLLPALHHLTPPSGTEIHSFSKLFETFDANSYKQVI